jgi:hypothetical protein
MSKKACNVCEKEINPKTENAYFIGGTLKSIMKKMNIHDLVLEKMQNDDLLCWKCGNKVYSRHAVEVYNYNKSVLLPEEFEELILKKCGDEDWVSIAQAELGINSQTDDSKDSMIASSSHELLSAENEKRVTTMEELNRLIALYHDKFKRQWEKNGIVQFKNENIAILQRAFGAQVHFLVAYDRLTKEGYRLMAIDEGKTGGQASGGFTGGVNSYYYFQKMD